MKKVILSFYIMLSILLFPKYVDAKIAENTCSYSGTYTYTQYGNEKSKDISITCDYFSNNTGQCNISTSLVSQPISNWGSYASFDAKQHYTNTKNCFAFMVFVDKDSIYNRYEVYAADTRETALKIAAEQGALGYGTSIISITGSESNTDTEDELQQLYNKMDDYINLINKMNTDDSPWDLGECLDEDGNLNSNAANYYVCKNRVQQFYNDINGWEAEIQEAVDSGLIDEDDSKLKEFKAAIGRSRGNINDVTDSGLYEGDSGGNKKPDYDGDISFDTSKTLEGTTIFGRGFGQFLKKGYNLIKFAVPVIIIAMAIIDFIKATASQDQKEINKAATKLVKRLIIGVVIFVLPTILEFIFKIASVDSGLYGIGKS